MKALLGVLCLLLIAGCGSVYHHNLLHRLNDQNDVIAATNRLFICTDNRDWACVRDVFAPEVQFDMTSLGAPKAEKKTPQQITDMWTRG